jgi:hypothetical protein
VPPQYHLRGAGHDGQPFTAGDIVPQVDTALLLKRDLLIETSAQP